MHVGSVTKSVVCVEEIDFWLIVIGHGFNFGVMCSGSWRLRGFGDKNKAM